MDTAATFRLFSLSCVRVRVRIRIRTLNVIVMLAYYFQQSSPAMSLHQITCIASIHDLSHLSNSLSQHSLATHLHKDIFSVCLCRSRARISITHFVILMRSPSSFSNIVVSLRYGTIMYTIITATTTFGGARHWCVCLCVCVCLVKTKANERY